MKLLGALYGAMFWVACCMAGSSGTTLRLAWDASPDTNVIGYHLLWGTNSGAYSSRTNVGNVTAFTLAGLEEGKTFFIVVTAIDENLVESDPSNEVIYQAPWRSLRLQSVSSGTTLQLAWNAHGDTNVIGYYLHWGTESGTYSSRTNVGNVTAFTLAGLEEGKTFFIVVTAIDENLVESDPSNEVIYQVPVRRFQIQMVPQSHGVLVAISIPVESERRYALEATEDFITWVSIWRKLYVPSNRTEVVMEVIRSAPSDTKQRYYRLKTF
jgi:hypothetical protein